LRRPQVRFGDVDGSIIISAEQFIVARVPDGAASGQVVVATNGHKSNPGEVRVGVPIAENLHPVANPAIHPHGNIYVTFSGPRGQKVPVAIYRVDNNYNVKPFLHEMMNATGMAFDRAGSLYVSSRYDGTVYRVAQNGTMTSYAEGMGVATGIAFDPAGNLYVGDRSGTIFKIDPDGAVSVFYRGLGRPQGLAVDVDDNLYVTASLNGRRGIVRVTPDRKASLVVSGQNLVGLAFARGASAVLATTTGVHHLSWDIEGRRLIPKNSWLVVSNKNLALGWGKIQLPRTPPYRSIRCGLSKRHAGLVPSLKGL